MGSEVGVLEVPADQIVHKGRLQPGKMFLIDTIEGRIVEDDEIKGRLAEEKPYRKWLDDNLVNLSDLPESNGEAGAGLLTKIYSRGKRSSATRSKS